MFLPGRLLLVLLLCALAPRTAAAQQLYRAQRLQRMVIGTHLQQLRNAAAPKRQTPRSAAVVVASQAIPARLPLPPDYTLGRRITVPLGSRADLSVGARFGSLGLAPSIRWRLRF